MKNLVLKYLREKGLTLQDYVHSCVTLSGDVVDWLRQDGTEAKILYCEDILAKEGWGICPAEHKVCWRFHAAVLVGDTVHDGWLTDPVKLESYAGVAFPGQEITLNVINSTKDLKERENAKSNNRKTKELRYH
jgi:hypothetical protein